MNRKGNDIMKNILNYQTTEYDCGPTTITNAIRYLFDRKQIPPDILKAISLYTLDAYNEKGESGKCGTSQMAMRFLSSWLNQYGKTNKFPIFSQFIEGEQVYIGQNSAIIGCLQQNGVAVVRVLLGDEGHYVLINDITEDEIGLFDPYYVDKVPDSSEISVVKDQPGKMNRRIKANLMNHNNGVPYALGTVNMREAMLIYNTDTRKTQEKTVEYII